jgi:iron(III) transport system ATP-binding protein
VAKLAISNARCEYAAFTAVHDFSLAIEPGEFISLLGPSGCGKTTMLRLIAGFIAPTRGTIALNGQTISEPGRVVAPERRRMSMIFQSYAIWPNMTVFQNVAFGLELRRVPTADIERKVTEMLDVVRLSGLAGRYPAELSGGQQQRVALARAVIVQPEVLLLDEPLSNLDANLREEMRLEIRRMHDEFKMTTVYVTHDQAEAMATSDRVVVMQGGRIEQAGSPREIYDTPATRFVASFIGRTNFLSGRRSGLELDFGAFVLPAGLFPSAMGNDCTISVRPHNLRLMPAGYRSAEGRILAANGEIKGRAYFGDHIDYTVALAKGSTIVARTPASQNFAVGEPVTVEIDPDHISVIADDVQNAPS